MKSCSILTLLSWGMMQNIHKWNKVMQISDTATSDYSTHMELEASSRIVSAHLKTKNKQSYREHVVFFFFHFSCLPLVNQRSVSDPNHFIVSLFVCVNYIIKKTASASARIQHNKLSRDVYKSPK